MSGAGSALAAVHAAAMSSTAVQVPPAPGAAAPPAAATVTTAAELAGAFPDLCAAIRAEGATAERARIIGIEAHAMAGHEALIATMKADATVTPDMAAGRILAAEKVARGQQAQAIVDVEKVTGKVVAAPQSHPTAAAASEVEKGSTPDGWKAEYASSAALQAEFATVDDYVSLKVAESAGKVRVLGARR
ncbi:hypothetical protein I3J27_21470 [Bradyrhizobium xenonodulans]|uniref:Uncharacterized protein n=1 Tax=Bradyrhizobium xenonodulans TaxID=2736875 RepID=A0ABY7MBE9_9BRAD|nr:hypothetical protein [Bradyrhizobium xenonodulans]WBL75605.1 hypothetical protein I3J27_21470 [Bradyrhizobium xenonodulans]